MGKKQTRQRGSVTKLSENSFRVRVYAGRDPITKKDIYLQGTASSESEAEKLRTKYLSQVDENRHPRSSATVGQILDRWMTVHKVDDSTAERYLNAIDGYIKPTFGNLKVGKLTAEMLELFYARLQRCSEQCEGRRNGRDGHSCKPLSPASVRKIHFIIKPALRAAVRWDYVGVNVANAIDSPTVPTRDPDPPSAEEAAKVLSWAWKRDPEWATYLWLAMVTGCRRGELIGLQWADVDFGKRILTVAFSEQLLKRRRQRAKRRRKDTKTHQQRRIAFDSDTAELLLALRAAAQQRCAALGIDLPERAYLFSRQPDGSEPLIPDSVTQRYKRLALRLGLRSHRLHSLRHYTATELVAAGVDLRTIAGRLGHGSGGATTLRVYSAWAPEADQRAASFLGKSLPRPGRRSESEPILVNGMALACRCGNVAEWMSLRVDGFQVTARCAECGSQVAGVDPDAVAGPADAESESSKNPYQTIAASLRARIVAGELQPGDLIPTVKQLAEQFSVTSSTAQRAVRVLSDEGLVAVRSGVRTTVLMTEPSAASGVDAIVDTPR